MQNVVMDQEDENDNVIPGAWRNDANHVDMEHVERGNRVKTVSEILLQFASWCITLAE
jgi:hypothetical protein